MNIIFPVKKCKVRNRDHNWITMGIKISCKNKRNLYRKKKNGLVSVEEYSKYCKILRKVISEAKRKYNTNFILNSDNKTRATWSLVKKLSQVSQNNSVLVNFADKYGSPSAVLNKLNEYFINSCPGNPEHKADQSDFAHFHKSVFLYPTDIVEVKACISNLKNKKSVGEDEIPVSLLKECKETIAPLLSHIINLTFQTGVFPDALKTAQVKALYKKNEKDNEKNYRPISLLSNINKVFEKILYNRLIKFFEENNLLAEEQNGFRKKRSTIRAIYQALTKVLNSLNENKATLALLLDLSKAFDSVNHVILLQKLESLGVRGVVLRLLKSYLSNRMQCVVESDNTGILLKSDKVIIKKGVPQGSILGPLLYILYTNELPTITSEYMVLYADDTTLIFSESNKEVLLNKILSTVSLVKEYFLNNDLLLNIPKTQMLFFSSRAAEQFSVTYESTSFGGDREVSFLGVQVDRRLDWKGHVDLLSSSISKYCYALRIICDYVNEEAAVSAYYAYVQSRLSYGIIFWGNSCAVDRVLVVQKRCLRTMYKMKQTESCKNVFSTKKILTVVSLYILEAVLFVYENKDLFKQCDRKHKHDTRFKSNLLPEMCKYSYTQANVHFSIIKIYNSFPVVAGGLPKQVLKKIIKEYLCLKAFYTLNEFYEDKDRINIK